MALPRASLSGLILFTFGSYVNVIAHGIILTSLAVSREFQILFSERRSGRTSHPRVLNGARFRFINSYVSRQSPSNHRFTGFAAERLAGLLGITRPRLSTILAPEDAFRAGEPTKPSSAGSRCKSAPENPPPCRPRRAERKLRSGTFDPAAVQPADRPRPRADRLSTSGYGI
jgi:hypothetical protein